MQIFRCSFCGDRDETEFRYLGEAGNERPQPAEKVGDEAWAHYLYMRRNPKGATREIWMHLTCLEVFVMERDSLTHEAGRAVSVVASEQQP